MPTKAERERFDRDGFLIIRGALTPDEVGYYRNALDRVYTAAVAADQVNPGDGPGRGGRGDRLSRRRGALRPAAVACPVGQLFAVHAEGHVLWLHVPVDRDP